MVSIGCTLHLQVVVILDESLDLLLKCLLIHGIQFVLQTTVIEVNRVLLLLARRALLVWSERGGVVTRGTIIIRDGGRVAELSLKLHDLFILDLYQVDQHLMVLLIHLLIIEARTFFDCR